MAQSTMTVTSLEASAPTGSNDTRSLITPTALDERSYGSRLQQDPSEPATPDPRTDISSGRTAAIIGTLTGITLVGSFSTGLLTVGIPRMASDLKLADSLLLWPASVYALTIGCLLIIAGSIADLIGSRLVFLAGCFVQGIFVFACALAQTGIQLIMFRAMQGIGVAMSLPTAVSIITHSFASGKRRNLGLAFMGAGQPLGYLIGLVVGGLFVDTIGWRVGYYMCAGATAILFAVSFWMLPKDHEIPPFTWSRLKDEIDWVGAFIASTCLAMLSYVLAATTGNVSHIHESSNIALLSISLALVPAFIFWVGRQEKLNKPALIPNSFWKNTAFTSICITLLLSWAALNVMEWFLSLFFQDVQELSALETSLRFIPNIVSGCLANIATGFLTTRVRAHYLIFVSSILAAVSPLMMALVDPDWPYWYLVFWAVLLSPFSVDVMFTVAALVITDVFPVKTQALAGAVFQTLAQFGTSLGLAITASISASVTAHSDYKVKKSPQALMKGYRASFWVSFAWMVLACIVGGLGLRRVGKVGLKRE